jgi:hypothetical protein
MMYRPNFYGSNNLLGIVIHQVPQIMQAALSIFKMAANKCNFSSYVFAYMVDLLVAILKIKMAAYIICAT